MSNIHTVDKKELEYFAKQSDGWWDNVTPLHEMNNVRVPFIHEGLIRNSQIEEGKTNLSDVSILDVGCGGGILSEGLARVGYNVTGLDPSEGMIKAAREHAKKDPDIEVTYICSTIEEHSVSNSGKYDAVVTSEVLEHVNDPRGFLQSCVQAVKPGGSIFITTINRTIWAWIVLLLIFEYILRVIPYGTHLYSKFISPEEVELLLREGGCHVKSTKGLIYVPFIRKWYWISSLSTNYALHAVKRNS